MLRFALLPVPQALTYVAPALNEYALAVGASLSLDGAVYAPYATGTLAPFARSILPSAREAARHPLSLAENAAIEHCIVSVEAATPPLGMNARETLRAELRGVGKWVLEHHDADRGPLERFANSQLYRVRREFLRRYDVRRLWLELRDERQREATRMDPHARDAYLVWWQRRISLLQRKLSWHVSGLSGPDVAGELLVELIRAIDSGEEAPFVLGGCPGIEGTFSFLVRRKNWLRRRRRIHEVVPREAFGAMHERTPSGEDVVLAKEQRAEAQAVMDRAARRLSARQRRYFDAVLEDAREHGFVSEVRVAECLGVHKSSVSRALKVIVAMLQKTGAAEVLEGLKLDARRAKRRHWRIEEPAERPRPLLLATAPKEQLVSPQPPWLDVGDCVGHKDTGELGVVIGVEHCIVGPLYRVRTGGFERADLSRDDLEYRSPIEVPF